LWFRGWEVQTFIILVLCIKKETILRFCKLMKRCFFWLIFDEKHSLELENPILLSHGSYFEAEISLLCGVAPTVKEEHCFPCSRDVIAPAVISEQQVKFVDLVMILNSISFLHLILNLIIA
jgi:hypothetical protein